MKKWPSINNNFNLIMLIIFIAIFLKACTPIPHDKPSEPPKEKGPLIVGVWLTTGDSSNKLQRQPNISFGPHNGSNALQIQVDEEKKYQQIDGFGAAITDSSAWLIHNKLSENQREELMTYLFSKTDGIGISYIRIPMGSSDFSLTPYTYDDMPSGQTDTNLTNFSIAHDTEYIIPLIKQAKDLNPELKCIGSPWSAPAWMKTPATLNGGSLNSDYYQVYANYFLKFIQAYQAEGITIHAITIQNEPDFCTSDYPTMYMESIDQADFVKNYLGPTFQNNDINTKIFVWDHNWDKPNYPIDILNDPDARVYIAGSAWHCYEGTPDAQSQVHEAYPEKDIYFTECTGGNWDNNFASVLVWNIKELFIGTLRNWSKTTLLWNLALDEKDSPNIGGCGNNCRGVVTIYDSGAIGYELEYYIIGHLSKFIDPGSYRIESNSYDGQIETVAFQNPDGSNVLIALNSNTESTVFDVLWHDQHFSYTLLPQSVATFKWKANIGEPKNTYQDFEGSGELGWSGSATVRKTDPEEPVHSGDYAFRAESSENWNYFYVRSKDQSWDVDFIQENNDSMTFWIYALPSGDGEGKDNTVCVKFYDNDIYNENGFEAWTKYSADFDQWTKLTILFSQLPSDFDLLCVNKLEFKNYWQGVYYIDDIKVEKEESTYQDFEGSGELGWSGSATVRKTDTEEPVHSGDYAFRAESSENWNYFYVRSKDQSWDVDFIQENNDSMTFWIYALPSGDGEGKDNTVCVKFYDNDIYNENGFKVWTKYSADFDQWTKLTILFSQLPSDFDLDHVNKLEFKNYWPGVYYIDDIKAEKGEFFY